jgi:hypothetical protein
MQHPDCRYVQLPSCVEQGIAGPKKLQAMADGTANVVQGHRSQHATCDLAGNIA